MPAGAAGFSFSGISVISASVVRIIEAMLAAFCKAERATFAGSMIPAATIFIGVSKHVVAIVIVLVFFLRPAYTVNDHRSVLTAIDGELTSWFIKRPAQNEYTCSLVTFKVQVIQRLRRV